MDHVKPADVATSMIDAGVKKQALSPRDLLIRGALSADVFTALVLYVTHQPAKRPVTATPVVAQPAE